MGHRLVPVWGLQWVPQSAGLAILWVPRSVRRSGFLMVHSSVKWEHWWVHQWVPLLVALVLLWAPLLGVSVSPWELE